MPYIDFLFSFKIFLWAIIFIMNNSFIFVIDII